jgi:hypothetical protein
MRRTDFQINFIWALIVFIGAFFVSDYSLNYACQVTVIYLILAAIYHFSVASYYILREGHKSKSKIPAYRRKSIFSLLTILLFILAAVGIFASDKTRYFSTQYALHKMDRAMKKLPQADVEEAMVQLKNHPNDMRYCSPMFFPSLKNNDAKAIATYLAYYALSKKYCAQFWDWGRENCGYLKEYDFGNNALAGKRNIRLCEFAKKNSLVQKINLVGKSDEQKR